MKSSLIRHMKQCTGKISQKQNKRRIHSTEEILSNLKLKKEAEADAEVLMQVGAVEDWASNYDDNENSKDSRESDADNGESKRDNGGTEEETGSNKAMKKEVENLEEETIELLKPKKGIMELIEGSF